MKTSHMINKKLFYVMKGERKREIRSLKLIVIKNQLFEEKEEEVVKDT